MEENKVVSPKPVIDVAKMDKAICDEFNKFLTDPKNLIMLPKKAKQAVHVWFLKHGYQKFYYVPNFDSVINTIQPNFDLTMNAYVTDQNKKQDILHEKLKKQADKKIAYQKKMKDQKKPFMTIAEHKIAIIQKRQQVFKEIQAKNIKKTKKQ